jgi:hypothetical protein
MAHTSQQKPRLNIVLSGQFAVAMLVANGDLRAEAQRTARPLAVLFEGPPALGHCDLGVLAVSTREQE